MAQLLLDRRNKTIVLVVTAFVSVSLLTGCAGSGEFMNELMKGTLDFFKEYNNYKLQKKSDLNVPAAPYYSPVHSYGMSESSSGPEGNLNAGYPYILARDISLSSTAYCGSNCKMSGIK